MYLAERIHQARVAAGITQEEFAAALSVKQQTASRWETGVIIPGMDKLDGIAKVLGVDIDELLHLSMTTVQAKREGTSVTRGRDGDDNSRLSALEERLAALETSMGRISDLLEQAMKVEAKSVTPAASRVSSRRSKRPSDR